MPDGVHDRLHVVHPLLQRRRLGHRVGEPGAPLVENGDAREGAEALQQVGDLRHLPVVLDVRDEAGDEDQVEIALPEDLVGDVRVSAERVAGAWRRRHPGQAGCDVVASARSLTSSAISPMIRLRSKSLGV